MSRYEGSTDRYVCKMALPDGWRWVTLRADDGKIFDVGRNIFTLSGTAADYLRKEYGTEEIYAAYLEDALRDGDVSYGGNFGVSRYDIDGDGEAETLLYLQDGESGGAVYVYETRENRPLRIGRMPVSSEAAGGLYVYRKGLITADGETGGLRYFVLKDHRLSEERDWPGSGRKTAFEHVSFYGIYHDEIEITPRFREYAAAGEG